MHLILSLGFLSYMAREVFSSKGEEFCSQTFIHFFQLSNNIFNKISRMLKVAAIFLIALLCVYRSSAAGVQTTILEKGDCSVVAKKGDAVDVSFA